MRTLGDELISSELVAVIELVKNAYDADATRVLVRFHEPLERGTGGIDILDDGHGMTLGTIEGAWLEPATPYRRRGRLSETLGREVLGEKGVGRFAVSRLADDLELITRRPDAPMETTVLFDWRVFDDDDAYLEDIEIAWEQGGPSAFVPGGESEALWMDGDPPAPARLCRGTLLRLTTLRTTWGPAQLRHLSNGLSRLVSPFLFETQRERPDAFSIRLDIPSMPDLSGPVEPPEALRNPHYTLNAHVDANGVYTAKMSVRGRTEPIVRSSRVVVDETSPVSGPFDVELRVWDRDAASMSELAGKAGRTAKQVRSDLNDAAGVNVYRDGFRVLPYGEPGDDWLQLDSRRVNNPTLRVSNSQIVGYLLIGRDQNPDLRDQTNREGLIRNRAFDDLVRQVRSILAELETERYAARPREPRAHAAPGGLFAGLDLAAMRTYASEKYPHDERLAALLGETQSSIDEGVERAQEVVARYRRLATLGELIDKVLHDGKAPLGKIGGDVELALRDISARELDCEALVTSLRTKVVRLGKQHGVLSSVFNRIEPFSGRKRGRPAQRALEEVIADSVGVLETDLARLGVTVDLPTSQTSVTADEHELQQVFVNLLRNSIHWLSHVPRERRRLAITTSKDADGLHIIFSDSGPGVREDIRDRIFDPYFSTAENGVGLGLSIAGEIAEDYYAGKLELLPTGPLPGANFQVTLRRRV